jgi:predicted oxidoreductase
MKTISLGNMGNNVPAIIVGCMRMQEIDEKKAERFVAEALELGANYFDHADIYGGGVCEEMFAKAIHMTPSVREKIFLQDKCGIVIGKKYDLSKEYILKSVEESLKRLHTDYLDMFLLHRPDALMEPEEIAEAFDTLEQSGKVRNFGVSNMKPAQIELLKKHVRQPLQVNQLQLGIMNASMITNGMNVNTQGEQAVDRDGDVLDYCRLHDVTIQAWSPFQSSQGVFLNNDKFPELNRKIAGIAEKYQVSDTTIAIAWIMRIPASIQPIIGSMNIQRMRDCIRAAEIRLTRDEWYEIYLAANYVLP